MVLYSLRHSKKPAWYNTRTGFSFNATLIQMPQED